MIRNWRIVVVLGILVSQVFGVQQGIRRPRGTRLSNQQIYERLKLFDGESLNSKELVVFEETSVGYLSKQKRELDPNLAITNKAKSTHNQGRTYLKNPKDGVVATKSKYANMDGHDAWEKQTAADHEYYRTHFGYECYDKYENQYYKVNETWETDRPINAAGDVRADYKCLCEGGDIGRYMCKPIRAPCFSKYTERYHDVGTQFEINTNNDVYSCYCYGGPTGRYECEEKEHGCYDSRHNHKKYRIGEKFEQHRKSDNLIYDCECQYGSTVKERVIMCSLKRYCIIEKNNKRDALMIGDSFDVFNKDGKASHRCFCERNSGESNSNRLHCVPIRKHKEIVYRPPSQPSPTNAAKSTDDEIEMKRIEEDLEEDLDTLARTREDYDPELYGDAGDIDLTADLDPADLRELGLDYGPYGAVDDGVGDYGPY